MIPKGTLVLIKTTNGGECMNVLAAPYNPTFDVELADFTIPHFRVASVEPVLVGEAV